MSHPEPPPGASGSGAFPPAPPADLGTYPPAGPGFTPGPPPSDGGGGSRSALIAVVVVVVVVLAAIGGFFLLRSDDGDDSSDTTTGAGDQVSVLDLAVGDCWIDIPDNGVKTDTVSTVPCTDPHEGEVYAVFDLDMGDDWPGQDQVSTGAEDQCVQEFEGFVGIAYESSALSLFYFSPTEDSWTELGDRGAVCVVLDPDTPDGQTTGTLQGAAR